MLPVGHSVVGPLQRDELPLVIYPHAARPKEESAQRDGAHHSVGVASVSTGCLNGRKRLNVSPTMEPTDGQSPEDGYAY